jgi:hypothetical protein
MRRILPPLAIALGLLWRDCPLDLSADPWASADRVCGMRVLWGAADAGPGCCVRDSR